MAAPLKPRPARRLLKWSLGLLLVLVVLWSGAWFAAAWYAKRTFDEQMANLRTRGVEIACAERDVTGFPVAFRFDCDAPSARTRQARGDLDGLVAGISLFSPNRLEIEPTGPGRVLPVSGVDGADTDGAEALEFGWADMRATIIDPLSLGRRFDARFADLVVKGPFGSLTASSGSLIVEPVNGNDAAFATLQRDLAVAPTWSSALPEVALPRLEADLVVHDIWRLLIERRAALSERLRRGFTGRVERLTFGAMGDGVLVLSGPFEVDDLGRIGGTFTIGVRNAKAVAALVQPLVGGGEAELALTALETIGVEREIEGERVRALEIVAVDGRIPIGFFSIKLPPLWVD